MISKNTLLFKTGTLYLLSTFHSCRSTPAVRPLSGSLGYDEDEDEPEGERRRLQVGTSYRQYFISTAHRICLHNAACH